MIGYECIISNQAVPASGKDFIVLSAGQFRSFFIDEIETWGDGTSSLYAEFGFYVPSALGTGGGLTAIVPQPVNQRLAAFSGTFSLGPYTTTQSTIPAVSTKTIGVNGNGQHNLWRPKDSNWVIDVPAAGGGAATAAATLIVRPVIGFGLFSCTFIIRVKEVG